ncbi:MAG: hypothetical protein IKA23_04335 [Akkermansia sp.]|nr:hypothetical protein [Akkermansia sp.]MBR2313728.1 hypothetical protein [Akkermansia sp.]
MPILYDIRRPRVKPLSDKIIVDDAGNLPVSSEAAAGVVPAAAVMK